MARAPRDSGPPEAPRSVAETPPPSYPHTVEMGYIVENLMQIQNSLGGVREALDSLKISSRSHSDKLEKINKIIFAAGAVLAVVLSIGGYLLNKIGDSLLVLLTKGHP